MNHFSSVAKTTAILMSLSNHSLSVQDKQYYNKVLDELVVDIQQNDDFAKRSILVSAYYNIWANKPIKKWHLERAQEAAINFDKILNKFNPEKGNFFNFANFSVNRRIKEVAIEYSRGLMPKSAYLNRKKLFETYAEFEEKHGREMTDQEAIAALGWQRGTFYQAKSFILPTFSEVNSVDDDEFINNQILEDCSKSNSELSAEKLIDEEERLFCNNLLAQAFLQLNKTQQEVLKLRYVKELSSKQIQQTLGVARENTVNVRLSRARQAFRSAYMTIAA